MIKKFHAMLLLVSVGTVVSIQVAIGSVGTAWACARGESPDILCSNEQQYVNDLAASGIKPTKSPRGLVDLGWKVCGDLHMGRTIDVEANRVYSYNTGLGPPLNHTFVELAVKDLCPEAATPHYVPPGYQPTYNLP